MRKGIKKILLSVSVIFVLIFLIDGKSQAEAATYSVQSGDTLFLIGQIYSVSAADLQRANGLNSAMIYPGQSLSIPGVSNSNQISYTVRSGDTLFLIGQRYGVTANQIRQASGLSSNTIYPGQVLTIPVKSTVTASRGTTTPRGTTASTNLNQEDIYWLARMINAEARGESYEGQVAVGAVILNRVRHTDFPNTVYGVLFEITDGRYYQFSPVQDGAIWLEPNTTAFRAAEDAARGWDPSGGAIYFYNPVTSTNQWIFSRPVIKQIGKHVFAR